MVDEVFDQQGNVFSSFPQRRNLNRKDVETVKQVATKRTCCDGSLQVAVGGGDEPHVSADRLIATHALKLMFLQNTQQRNLSVRGQLTDFVKEEGAFFRKLEPAQSPLGCPRKGTLLMTKQLRCNQRRGDCSTIHTHESTRGSLRSFVNRPGDQLFACACFTC